MTRTELEGLGLTDAVLVAEYRRLFARTLTLPKQDTLDVQAARRDAFNDVCFAWYKESGS